jgi:mono/diheme cytochrome c family protein
MEMSRVIVLLGAVLLVATLSGQSASAQGSAAAGGVVGNSEHGRYLVEQVAMCGECHSTRDAQGNIVPGTRFMGGPMPFRPQWSADWPVSAPRIAGLPGYTDELAIRLLTQGAIKRDGTPLRRPMPAFRMTPQDAADIIVYLRSR